MRILIIEDNRELRETLCDAFREEGYDPDAAETGDVGLYKALNWDYHLVILDVMLPEVDGWKILQSIRQKKPVPIIMVTARVGLADRVRGLRDGADDYLPKPFELDELIARAAAVLRRVHSPVPAEDIEIGEVRIELNRRKIYLRGEEIEMTPLEFHIVRILMQNQGVVISRTHLYDQVFEEDGSDSLSNMVDVYICRLRGKLGRDFIKTRRGHGYIVDSESPPSA